MPAPVRIESMVWDDWRFEALADAAGLANVYEAIGRMAKIWSACTDRKTAVLSEAAIKGYLGINGAAAIVAVELGEVVEGGIRVRGSARFESLWEKQQQHQRASSAGGLARVGSKDQDGRFAPVRRETSSGETVAQTTKHQPESSRTSSRNPADEPAGNQPESSLSVSFSVSDSPISDPVSTKPEQPKVARAKRHLHEDWQPTERHREMATKLGLDVAAEGENFRDHHRGRGNRFLDWDLTFNTWLRNAKKFSRGGATARPGASIGSAPPSSEHGTGVVDPRSIR